jgi:hypothetical protein
MRSAVAKVNSTPLHATKWPRKTGVDRALAMGS